MQRTTSSTTRRPAWRWPAVGVLTALAFGSAGAARAEPAVKQWTSWPIVISAKGDPAERHAATEFRDLVARATGARMEIVTDTSPRKSAVLIGTISLLKADDLDEEAFRIKVSDWNVEVRGGGPRGTLYGVYQFLEDELGVRFLTPDHTYVPRVEGDRTLKAGERTFRPRFSWRYSYYGANMAHPAFAARLRNNAVTDRPELGGRSHWSLISHSVHLDVPVAKLGKAHPEYFSLVNGKRRGFMSDDQFEQGGTQPCFTNPEVRKLIIEGVLGRLRHEKQTDGNVSVSQNDNTMYCRCDNCRAIDEREESHMGALLTLVNEVGEAVARERPGVFVGTLAYQFSRVPPRSMKPAPNVAIQLCSIEACQLHPLDDPKCPRNVSFCKDLEGWCRICNHVYVWNYNTNFTCYNAPCPNLDVIGPNVRFLAAHGVNGVFMQAAGNARNTELCDLRNYLISRLLWDPSLDDRKIVEEFVGLHYGRAADQVRAYLALIGDAARRSGLHQHCFGTATSYGIDAKVARQAIALLEKGMAAAENEDVRRRVEKVSIAPRTVLIEPFARWVRNNQHRITTDHSLKAPPEVYKGIEAELREVFGLYQRHDVSRFAEWVSTDEVKQTLPEGLLR